MNLARRGVKSIIGLIIATAMLATSFSCCAFDYNKMLDKMDDDADTNSSIVRLKFQGGMKVRGWEVGEKRYFGQTKIAGQWGLGLVVSNGNTTYGVNNKGFSIIKSF